MTRAPSSRFAFAPAVANAEGEQRVARARVSHTVAVRQAFAAMHRGDTSATRHTLVAVWARGDELMQLQCPFDAAANDSNEPRLALMADALKDVPYEKLQEFNARSSGERDVGHLMMIQAVRRSLRDREPLEFTRKMAAEAFDIFSEIDSRQVSSLEKCGAYQTILLELEAVVAHVKFKWPGTCSSLDVFGLLNPAVQRGNQGLVRWSLG